MRVGIAGIGFMGWIHWLAYQQHPQAQVVAICESNPDRRRGDWTQIQGNFGPPGQQIDLSEIAVYDDLREFCRGDFDLLDICLPPALHGSTIELGAREGKHLFCEKPLALNVLDCQAALEVCRQNGSLLLVGHVLPYFPEFRVAWELVESEQYGKMTSAYFKRIISNPVWLPDFFDPHRIGGPLFDLHVHDAHFIRLLAGLPQGVYSRGHLHCDVVRFCHSIFDFEDPDVAIAASMGVIDQQGRPFTHGFEIQMQSATLHFEFADLKSGPQQMPLKLISDDGQITIIEVEKADPIHAFEQEIKDVVAAVQTGMPKPNLSGEYALDAIRICQAEAQSVSSGQRVAIGAPHDA